MKVTVLGSGTPSPTPDRYGSAFAVRVGAVDTIMFDCGPGATHKLVKAGLDPTDVTDVFFTHHHYDHNADYATLMLCRWDHDIGDLAPLRARGPTHTALITERLIGDEGAFAFDWKARVGHPASQHVFVNRGGTLPRKPPRVDARDIGPATVVERDDWLVRTSHAQHVQPYLDSLAYRLDSDEGSIVFTGDTQPCADVEELAAGADVLFAMCWDTQDRMEESGEDRGQMGTVTAPELARRAGVDTLVLVHTGPHLSQPAVRDAALQRARDDVPASQVLFAHEGMVVDLAT